MHGYVAIGLTIIGVAVLQFLLRKPLSDGAVRQWTSIGRPDVAKTSSHWQKVTVKASIWLGVIGFVILLIGLGSEA